MPLVVTLAAGVRGSWADRFKAIDGVFAKVIGPVAEPTGMAGHCGPLSCPPSRRPRPAGVSDVSAYAVPSPPAAYRLIAATARSTSSCMLKKCGDTRTLLPPPMNASRSFS